MNFSIFLLISIFAIFVFVTTTIIGSIKRTSMKKYKPNSKSKAYVDSLELRKPEHKWTRYEDNDPEEKRLSALEKSNKINKYLDNSHKSENKSVSRLSPLPPPPRTMISCSNKKVMIHLICPICNKEKNIQIPNRVIINSKSLSTVNIKKGSVCEHSFQAYVDKNLLVRGYQKVDFDY